MIRLGKLWLTGTGNDILGFIDGCMSSAGSSKDDQ